MWARRCLGGSKRVKVNLRGPRVVFNGPSASKTILKMNEKPNSKLRLPKVTIRGQIIPQPKSLRWLKKKVSSMSSYGPPRNYCKVSNKYLIGHVLGGQN